MYPSQTRTNARRNQIADATCGIVDLRPPSLYCVASGQVTSLSKSGEARRQAGERAGVRGESDAGLFLLAWCSKVLTQPPIGY